MSDYLVNQLKATPNIDVRLRTQVVAGRGRNHLETLTLEDQRTGRRKEAPATAVFVLIGAEPCTDWLGDVVKLDERGFVLTGDDIPQPAWPGSGPPLPFETSVPGVFAAADVRYGSVKRVAGAVGEGSYGRGDRVGVSADEYVNVRKLSALPPNAYKPFGTGQRACIGRQFAIQEAILVLGLCCRLLDRPAATTRSSSSAVAAVAAPAKPGNPGRRSARVRRDRRTHARLAA